MQWNYCFTVLLAVSESNTLRRKRTTSQPAATCFLPGSKQTISELLGISIIQLLIINHLQIGNIQRIRWPVRCSWILRRHTYIRLHRNKCTMKLYPLDMLLAVGGSDNLIEKGEEHPVLPKRLNHDHQIQERFQATTNKFTITVRHW